MHSIKLSRARKMSIIGDLPATYDAMLAHLPPSLVEAAPARVIADVIDSLYRASLEAKSLHERDIIAEGAVWDAERQEMRPIAQANTPPP